MIGVDCQNVIWDVTGFLPTCDLIKILKMYQVETFASGDKMLSEMSKMKYS
jgi:hypothetical protein